MALPADLGTFTVTAKYTKNDGTPASGTVDFVMPVFLRGAGSNNIVTPGTFTATLDGTGAISIVLPRTDDPDYVPNGWTYTVNEKLGVATRSYTIPLTANVDLADVSPVNDPSGGVQYVLTTMVGQIDGPAGPLDGDGKIPLEQLPALGGSGTVTSVAGIGPDGGGNVPLTAANISALPTAGGTMTGNLTLAGAPSSALHAATKQYVDDNAGGGGGGGGPQTISFNATEPLTVDPGVDRWVNRTGVGLEVMNVWAALGAPASAGDTIIDVLKGDTMADTPTTIFSGSDTPEVLGVSTAFGGATTSQAVDFPVETAAGQAALLVLSTVGVGTAVATPSDIGFEPIAGFPTTAGSRTGRYHAFFKPLLVSGDVEATVTLDTGGTGSVRWAVHLILLSPGTTLADLAIDVLNTVGATVTAPSVADVPAGALIIRGAGPVGDTSGNIITWAPPAGHAEIAEVCTTAGLRNATLATAWDVQDTEGATGTAVFTPTGSIGGDNNIQRQAFTMAFVGSGGGGGRPTIAALDHGGDATLPTPGTIIPDGGFIVIEVAEVGTGAASLTGGVVVQAV